MSRNWREAALRKCRGAPSHSFFNSTTESARPLFPDRSPTILFVTEAVNRALGRKLGARMGPKRGGLPGQETLAQLLPQPTLRRGSGDPAVAFNLPRRLREKEDHNSGFETPPPSGCAKRASRFPRSTLWRDRRGNCTHLLWTGRNISNALRARKRDVRERRTAMPFGNRGHPRGDFRIWKRRDGRLLPVAGAYKEFLGYRDDELPDRCPKSFFGRIHPEDSVRWRKLWIATITNLNK